MNASPLISIIIPCYNGGAFIAEAIESVVAQSLEDWELIIIDDGSVDNSKEIVKEFTKDKRISLLSNERNLGIAKTKNKGVKNSKGEFIAFLDQDDLWSKDKLELQIARLRADSKLAVICTGMFYTDRSLNNTSTFTGYDDTVQTTMIKDLFITPINSSSLMMVRRSSLSDESPFDETLKGWDDFELLMRLAVQYKIGYVREPLVKKRIHSGGAQRLDEVTDEEGRVFDHILRLHPFLVQFKKERDAALFLGRACERLSDGNIQDARSLARRRLRLTPLSPASWVLFIVTLLPSSIAREGIKFILMLAGQTKLFIYHRQSR